MNRTGFSLMNKLSPQKIKILRVIYNLEAQGLPIIGPKEISERLQISKSYAFIAMKELTKQGYLLHFPRKGFRLSEKGKKVAKRLIRNHRILEIIFVKYIGFDRETACCFARVLESRIPSHIVEEIANRLGNPTVCPCGYRIPAREECEEGIIP